MDDTLIDSYIAEALVEGGYTSNECDKSSIYRRLIAERGKHVAFAWWDIKAGNITIRPIGPDRHEDIALLTTEIPLASPNLAEQIAKAAEQIRKATSQTQSLQVIDLETNTIHGGRGRCK